MPFLSSSGSQAMEQESEEDPREQAAQKQIQKNRLRRRIIGISAAALLVLLIVLYVVFLGGYKLAAYRYIKGVDYSSGSMYVALVPDSYMDYLKPPMKPTAGKSRARSRITSNPGTRITAIPAA